MAGHKLELEDDVSGVQWQCQKKMLETGVASATTTPVAGHKFEFEDNDVSGIKWTKSYKEMMGTGVVNATPTPLTGHWWEQVAYNDKVLYSINKAGMGTGVGELYQHHSLVASGSKWHTMTKSCLV